MNATAAIFSSLIDNYNWLFYDIADPRAQKYFLISSPIPLLVILFVYYCFVTKWGPEMMKDRKPFNIDGLVQLYNLMQIAACIFFSFHTLINLYGPNGPYNFSCTPLDYSENEISLSVVRYSWLYFMLKFVDLLDTVFFVLRKKNSQITGLHLYHHMGMFALAGGTTKYLAGGQSFFLGVVNCLVHAVMYAYYFVTNRYPQRKQNLWWKKYVTQLQMFQFVIAILFFGQVLFRPNCKYPTWPVLFVLPHNIAIFYAFARLYKRAYLSNEKTKTN